MKILSSKGPEHSPNKFKTPNKVKRVDKTTVANSPSVQIISAHLSLHCFNLTHIKYLWEFVHLLPNIDTLFVPGFFCCSVYNVLIAIHVYT